MVNQTDKELVFTQTNRSTKEPGKTERDMAKESTSTASTNIENWTLKMLLKKAVSNMNSNIPLRNVKSSAISKFTEAQTSYSGTSPAASPT